MSTAPGIRSRTIGRTPGPALVLIGVLLVAANLRASITTVGPVIAEVQHELGLASVAASVLVSLPVLAFGVVSPLAPVAMRRLGVEPSLAAALALLAIGIVLRSVPGSASLWVGTALLGVAIAVLNVALPAVVKRDFPTRIGQLTGAYSSVQAVFAAIAAGVAVPIAGTAESGWRLAFGVWAGLALIALAVFAPQLRGRVGDGRRSQAARGAGRDAAEASEAAADAGRDAPDTARTVAEPARWRSPWRSALGWQVTVFMGMQSTTFYVLVTWLPSIERAGGVPAEAAGFHQLLFNGLGIAGSLSAAALIPQLRGPALIVVVGPALLLISVLGLLFAPLLGGLWACLAGVGGGATIVLALSLFGLRTGHHSQAAALSGMAQSVGYLLAASGPILMGLIHDATGEWEPVLVILAAVCVVQTVFGLLSTRPRVIG